MLLKNIFLLLFKIRNSFTETEWMYRDRKLSSKTVDRMPQACGSLDRSQFCAGKKDLESCEEPSGSALTHQINYIGPNRTVQFGIANLIETKLLNLASLHRRGEPLPMDRYGGELSKYQ